MVRLAQVTANSGSLLIELEYNNSSAGFQDEYNHLHYPAMLVDTLAMIADGFCDWNT